MYRKTGQSFGFGLIERPSIIQKTEQPYRYFVATVDFDVVSHELGVVQVSDLFKELLFATDFEQHSVVDQKSPFFGIDTRWFLSILSTKTSRIFPRFRERQ